MPGPVEIGVFNIARSEVDKDEVKKWLDFIGVEDHNMPEDGAVTNPALLIALAAKRCYKAFEVNSKLNPNITRVRKDYLAYLDNILASGHGSVLEHAVYTFSFENVSRVFTGEMNRHRAGWAISEGSMRYIRFDDIPYWVPDSLKGEDVYTSEEVTCVSSQFGLARKGMSEADAEADSVFHSPPAVESLTLDQRKQLSREIFSRAFAQTEANYTLLMDLWAAELAPDSKFHGKKQITSMMRRIVPMGVATGGVWTGNLRALRHVIAMRTSESAEEEILHVFSRVIKIMAEKEPMIFGDFEEDENGFWVPKYQKV